MKYIFKLPLLPIFLLIQHVTSADVLESAIPNGVSALTPISPGGICVEKIKEDDIVAADGTQLKEGGVSCSSNTQGLVMSANNMVSTLITAPADGATFDASINNTISLDNANLIAGFFSNANTEYYLAPQTQVGTSTQGHQHVTMQLLDGNTPLDASAKPPFFKGINDAFKDPANPQLLAVVEAGQLKANGVYRICTLTGADTHQPILSPVLKRGSQDDCIRVNVVNAVADDASADPGTNEKAVVATDASAANLES